MFFLFILFLPLISSKLLMVIEFSRHGAREPIYDFLNAKPFDSKGELTPVGMKQHYLLGKTLRSMYIENETFLSPSYHPKEIYVRSTNYNRTILSAISQLYGLYPLGTGPDIDESLDRKYLSPPFTSNFFDFQVFAKNLHNNLENKALNMGFQPIPVHVVAMSQDSLLRPFDISICPLNVNLQNSQYNSNTFKEWTDLFKDNTFKELSKLLNITYNDMSLWVAFDIFDIYDNFRYSNQPVPANLSIDLERNLTFIHNVMIYFVYFGSENQRRLLTTPIFNEILRYFDGKINKTIETKFIYYSGHDRTLSMVLSGLNYSSYECLYDKYLGITNNNTCLEMPTYASNILIELHENSTTQYVKIKYNGKYLPMCGSNLTSCKYSVFSKKLNDFIVKDFVKQCQKDIGLINKTLENEEKNSAVERNAVAKVFAFLFGLIIGVSIVAAIFYYKFVKRENDNNNKDSGYFEF